MKITLLPKTNLGKSAVLLSIIFILLFWLRTMNWASLPTFMIAALGLIGSIKGLQAIIKHKERAALVILSLPLGILIVFWTIHAMISPY